MKDILDMIDESRLSESVLDRTPGLYGKLRLEDVHVGDRLRIKDIGELKEYTGKDGVIRVYGLTIFDEMWEFLGSTCTVKSITKNRQGKLRLRVDSLGLPENPYIWPLEIFERA